MFAAMAILLESQRSQSWKISSASISYNHFTSSGQRVATEKNQQKIMKTACIKRGKTMSLNYAFFPF
jgi:hypothetical protein